MEFRIETNPIVSKELNVKKEVWSVEDCKQYVERNSRLPSVQRGAPLHKVLKNAKFQISEKKEVGFIGPFHRSPFRRSLNYIWKG